MQAVARVKEIRTSPRKVRLVADAIRDLSLQEAQDALSVIQKRGAYDLEKVLKSAIANAVNNGKLDKENLVIKNIDVSEGTSLKRFRPSTRGRVHRYEKRSTSIRIVLEEKVSTGPKEIAAKSEDKKGSADAKAVADKGNK